VKFKCFDLETTGVDVATCEVVQAAVVEASAGFTTYDQHDRVYPAGVFMTTAVSRSMLFYAATIPAGATAVHGITAEMVANCKPFGAVVRSFVQALTEPDVVIVTFNGCLYDIPIIARYAAKDTSYKVFDVYASPGPGPETRDGHERRMRARHIDVMRLWWRVRRTRVLAAWQGPLSVSDGIGERCPGCWPMLTADMFAGSLTAAHGFYTGEGFDDAHNAGVDCLATLRVLHKMLCSGFVTVDTAVKWSNEPLPGDVDFAGKFKWEGDRAVITIGKQAGTPIEDVDRGFLQWMLGKDFPADTKDIARRFLAGEYPQRTASTTVYDEPDSALELGP
jgi:hypothetical protein